mmetsp:Transcript_20437/g.60918  ORF Transcript_20437/g.60918 Transcript_20437/m.60918 type:complete len:140 (-) Transcript_20437:8-427(-)
MVALVPKLQAWVRHAQQKIKHAVLTHLPNASRPIFLVTPIGKEPALNMTEWVLTDLIDALPQYTFLVGRSNTSHVALNAAAEMAVLTHAHAFIPFPSSQFGWWGAGRVRARGGETYALEGMEGSRGVPGIGAFKKHKGG